MTRPTVKAIVVAVGAIVLSTLCVQAVFAAVVLKGTIPPGPTPVVIIQPHKQAGVTGVVKFKFSAPTPGAYTLGFCIGPAANPCGMATSYVVQVHGGKQSLAVVPASMFENNVLAVSQGTSSALPFVVEME